MTLILGGGYQLPPGGTLNQVIAKKSALEGDSDWRDLPAGPATMPPTLSLPLTSLLNWTTEGGTWVASAGSIDKTDAPAAHQRLRYTAMIAHASYVIECELKMTTGPANVNSRVGLAVTLLDAGGAGGVTVSLASNGSSVTFLNMEDDAAVGLNNTTLASPIAFDTYVRMRVWVVGDAVTVWLNDVLIATGRALINQRADNTTRYRFGLWTYQATGSWRNLKVWQLDPLLVGARGLPGAQGDTMIGNSYIAIGPAQPVDPANKPIWIKTS